MGVLGDIGDAAGEQFTELKGNVTEFVDELDAVQLLKDLPGIFGDIRGSKGSESGDGVDFGDIWDGFKNYFDRDDKPTSIGDSNGEIVNKTGSQRDGSGRQVVTREAQEARHSNRDSGDSTKSSRADHTMDPDDAGWESLIDDTLAGFESGGLFGGIAGAAKGIWEDKEVRQDVMEFGQDVVDIGEDIGDWFDKTSDKVGDFFDKIFD